MCRPIRSALCRGIEFSLDKWNNSISNTPAADFHQASGNFRVVCTIHHRNLDSVLKAPGGVPVTSGTYTGREYHFQYIGEDLNFNPGILLLILPDLSHQGNMDSRSRRTHRSSSGAGPLTGARQAVSR